MMVPIRPQGGFLEKKIMSRLGNYLRDTQAEMKHVSWPTKMQATIYTALVVGVSILVAFFIGAFDYIFTDFLTVFI